MKLSSVEMDHSRSVIKAQIQSSASDGSGLRPANQSRHVSTNVGSNGDIGSKACSII